MIAAWMLHQLVTALALGLAALAVEALIRIGRGPARWAWAAAIALSILLPVSRLAAAVFLPAPAVAALPAVSTAGGGAGDAAMWAAILERAELGVASGSLWQRLDRPLLALWLILSAGVACWAVAGAVRLWRARREWEPRTVEGASVLVSGRTGPALAGLIRPRVVLPEWALRSGRSHLRLMLAHEHEHMRARDPWLLAAGAAATILVPWSLPTRWMLRRLRLAVEMDCDARVLRRYPDVHRYGALLLDVGRLGMGPRLPLAALGNPPSTLERRIRAMTMPGPRHPRLLGLTLAGAAAALALAACEVPRPTEVAPEHELPLASVRSEGDMAPDASERVTLEKVRGVLLESDPELLSTRTGRQRMLWIVASADGQEAGDGGDVVTRVYTAAPPSVSPERIASVEVLKVDPGRLLPDSAVAIWVRLRRDGASGDTTTLVAGRPLTKIVSLRAEAPGDGPLMVSDTIRIHTRPRAGAREGGIDGDSSVLILRGVPARPSAGSADTLPLVAPGVRRVRIAGDPTSPVRMGTLERARPLVIVDGVVSSTEVMDDLVPDRIASVEVVKGAAGRIRYGERGANGVIIITTKPEP